MLRSRHLLPDATQPLQCTALLAAPPKSALISPIPTLHHDRTAPRPTPAWPPVMASAGRGVSSGALQSPALRAATRELFERLPPSAVAKAYALHRRPLVQR